MFRRVLGKLSAGQALILATVSLAFVRDTADRHETASWMTIRMTDALRLWEKHHNSGPRALY